MNHQSGIPMRSRRILLACLFAMGAGLSSTAMATDLPIRGGKGGTDFRAECAPGSYLIGLEGRNGAWVDQLAPVCAPWRWDLRAFGPMVTGSLKGTSTGGVFNKLTCAPDQAITGWYLFPAIGPNRKEPTYISVIHARCDRVEPPLLSRRKMKYLSFGCAGSLDCLRGLPRETWEEWCPPGELAVGIYGRAGLFVDAIGLICGDRPIALAPPASTVNPLAKAPPPPPAVGMNPAVKAPVPTDDMFTIVSPTNNDHVPPEQLIIMATAPKVGRTDVTEVELKFLDAPPAQRDSYPYTTVFSVNTQQLLEGYPVAQIVTGGYVGRWQVRARSSMKAIPGPWSFPVQFQLVREQSAPSQPPPPPMVQQAPVPNSSVTAPPATSPPSQLKRSPFMVQPRGVEGEPAAPAEAPAAEETH